MRTAALVVSTALQFFYLAGLIRVVAALALGVDDALETQDPKLLAGFLSTQAITLILGVVPGLAGVALMAGAVRGQREPPAWFVNLSVVFAISWLVLFPIGTIIGVLMLRWRSRVRAAAT